MMLLHILKEEGMDIEESRERWNLKEKRDNNRNKTSTIILNLLSFGFGGTLRGKWRTRS